MSQSAPPSRSNLLSSSWSPGSRGAPAPLWGGLIWARAAQDRCSGPGPVLLASSRLKSWGPALLEAWFAGRRGDERWGGGEWMGGGKAIIDGDWDVNSEGKCEWFCSTRRWESLKWSHWQGEDGLCEGERGVETPKLWFDKHQLLQFGNSFQHLTTDHHKVHLSAAVLYYVLWMPA